MILGAAMIGVLDLFLDLDKFVAKMLDVGFFNATMLIDLFLVLIDWGF